MTARILVHADGGACHGTPIVDGRCPKCGIAPDTQSTELWPQPPNPLDAGVISDMERPIVLSPDDADRVAALIEERPGPTEAMRALFAERRPCAGWAPDGYFPPGLAYELRAGEFSARVDEAAIDQAGDSEWGWSVAGPSPYERIIVRRNYAPTLDAAMLAAEDALLAVADAIRRAVGR